MDNYIRPEINFYNANTHEHNIKFDVEKLKEFAKYAFVDINGKFAEFIQYSPFKDLVDISKLPNRLYDLDPLNNINDLAFLLALRVNIVEYLIITRKKYVSGKGIFESLFSKKTLSYTDNNGRTTLIRMNHSTLEVADLLPTRHHHFYDVSFSFLDDKFDKSFEVMSWYGKLCNHKNCNCNLDDYNPEYQNYLKFI